MSALEWIIEVLSWAAILSGCAFMLIGAIGTVRFPDFWTRLHAVSVSDSAGMILLILGMCLQAGLTLITVKLILIGIFLFITGPTATHAVANAAMVSGFLPEGLKRPSIKTKKATTKATKAKTVKKKAVKASKSKGAA